jgi:hypothetical protein
MMSMGVSMGDIITRNILQVNLLYLLLFRQAQLDKDILNSQPWRGDAHLKLKAIQTLGAIGEGPISPLDVELLSTFFRAPCPLS